MEQQSEKSTSFDQWGIVEVMGHKKFAGHITEQVIAGSALVRVDVPEARVTDYRGERTVNAFSKLIGVASIYCITPTREKAQLEAFAKVKPTFGAAAESADDVAPDPAAKKTTSRRRKNAVDEEALNAEAIGEEEITERDDADGPACEYCGCTTLEACDLGGGPCSWYSEDPPVCSNPGCVDAFHCENDPVVAETGDVEDLEPVHAGAPAEG